MADRANPTHSTPEEGDRVRVTSGDYAGRCGVYEGQREDAFGSWHLVHLDCDSQSVPPLRVDAVEPAS